MVKLRSLCLEKCKGKKSKGGSKGRKKGGR